MGDRNPDKSLARSLGEFVGHIWRGVKADPSPDRREVGRTVERDERTTPDGKKVVLRRTTIDEIELKDNDEP